MCEKQLWAAFADAVHKPLPATDERATKTLNSLPIKGGGGERKSSPFSLLQQHLFCEAIFIEKSPNQQLEAYVNVRLQFFFFHWQPTPTPSARRVRKEMINALLVPILLYHKEKVRCRSTSQDSGSRSIPFWAAKLYLALAVGSLEATNNKATVPFVNGLLFFSIYLPGHYGLRFPPPPHPTITLKIAEQGCCTNIYASLDHSITAVTWRACAPEVSSTLHQQLPFS